MSIMNRHIIQNVLTLLNNKKMFHILQLKKICENDYLLPKIITFKKFYKKSKKLNRKNHHIYIRKYATNISIDFITWLNKFNISDEIFRYGDYEPLYISLSYHGNLDIVKWLYENKSKNMNFSDYEILQIVEKGHLNIIEWIYEKINNELYFDRISLVAAENGHLHIIKWICNHNHNHYFSYDSGVPIIMYEAAKNGHSHVIKWLYKKYPKFLPYHVLLDIYYLEKQHIITNWIRNILHEHKKYF